MRYRVELRILFALFLLRFQKMFFALFRLDFGNVKISEADFPKIEAKMAEILSSWKGFERSELTADEAKREFADNEYKKPT